MSDLEIVIGNKNYSSWSLRAWIAVKRCAVDFDEVMVQLSVPGSRETILTHSQAGLVPILKHHGLVIWETMAICEYLAETFPEAQLWPTDKTARSQCRAVANEMHAGFAALRTHMPMDIKNHYPDHGRGPGVQKDIDRITQIFVSCRATYDQAGAFLFGSFTIADAMFAPVVARFKTYQVDLPETAAAYCDAVWSSPEMLEWRAAAEAETWVIKP